MSNESVIGPRALSAPRAALATKEADVPAAERERMRQASEDFEAAFVSQMLKHAGFDRAFGEEAESYSHFMLAEIGSDMAEGMDLGFAEKAYQQMISRYGIRNDEK